MTVTLLGLMSSCTALIPYARLRMRPTEVPGRSMESDNRPLGQCIDCDHISSIVSTTVDAQTQSSPGETIQDAIPMGGSDSRFLPRRAGSSPGGIVSPVHRGGDASRMDPEPHHHVAGNPSRRNIEHIGRRIEQTI